MTTVPDDIRLGQDIFIITEGEHMNLAIVIYKQEKFPWGIETEFQFCAHHPSLGYFVLPSRPPYARQTNLKFQKLLINETSKS